mmetsp:Transcript_11383/g.13501  ORF Transcript_11383/g.13501 Transcript_11383/m.13501 type:complete len:98 (-) Transcript_11383:303-596(-)
MLLLTYRNLLPLPSSTTTEQQSISAEESMHHGLHSNIYNSWRIPNPPKPARVPITKFVALEAQLCINRIDGMEVGIVIVLPLRAGLVLVVSFTGLLL